MAIALVSHTIKQSSAGGSITTDAIDTTGASLLVLVESGLHNNGTGVISDSKSNTWLHLTFRNATSAGFHRVHYVVNPTVGSGHTFTCTYGGSGYPAIAPSAWSGVKTSSPFDVENGTASGTGSTTVATGSVTPSENGELLIAGLTCNLSSGAPDGVSIDNGFTVLDSAVGTANAYGVAAAYLIQGTAGAINPTWSWTTSAGQCASISAFKPVAGGLLVPRGFDGGFADKFVGGFAG